MQLLINMEWSILHHNDYADYEANPWFWQSYESLNLIWVSAYRLTSQNITWFTVWAHITRLFKLNGRSKVHMQKEHPVWNKFSNYKLLVYE